MMKNDRLYHVWNVVLLLCILPFVLLAFYAYPSIHDDYLGANSLLKVGSIEYVKNNYLQWTGRYTELVFKSILSPLTYSKYILVENVLTLSMIGGVFFAFYITCRIIVGVRHSIQISLLIMSVFICGLTDVSSFFYWSGGYTAYTVGVIFTLFFLAFLYRLRTSKLFADLIICSVLIILASGTYEVVMISMLWITITNVLYSKMQNKNLLYPLVLFVVNVVSAGFSVFAPGNYARASTINSDAVDMSFSRIIISAFKSVFFAAEYMVSWINSLFLLLGIMILYQGLCKTRQIVKLKVDSNPLLVSLWVFLGISASIIPSVAAYQAVWLHTWQCVYFFFLAGWLLIFNSTFFYFDKKYNIQSFLLNRRIVWATQIGFVMIAFLSSSSNIHIAYRDLLYAPDYKRRVEARIDKMKWAARENKIVELNPLFLNSEKYLIPQTLYTIEYNDADAQAFAAYYGVDSVVVNRCHLQ